MKTVNNYTETDLGNVSPNPRGKYDNATAYEYLDLVSLGGGSYLCLAELGQTITGFPPVEGENTEHWQCVAIPGEITQEYTEIYADVKRLARETKEDAEKSETAKTGAETAQREAEKAKQTAIENAQESENSKDSAAGYMQRAETAAQTAESAKGTVENLVTGFDEHVVSKTAQAEQAIETAKDEAISAVTRQEKASVQEVKDQTASYITEQKNLAKQEIDKKINEFDVDVNAIKKEVSDEGAKQVKAVQDAQAKATEAVETAKTNAVQTVENEGTTQVGNVTAEGTKQVAEVQKVAQEIVADREQIQTNKTDIADLRQTKAGAIVESASGETIVVRDSSSHFFEDFRVLGKSEQGGNPSPDNKQNITNIGKNGSVGIKVRGKNLIQYPYIQSDKYDPMYNAKAGSVININGVTVTALEDRALKIVGTATTDAYINVMRDKVLVNKNDVKYSKDLSHDINNGLIFYLVKKDETINKIVYPQAEIGETVTEYEPWKGEQILTIPLEQPLARWDRIEKRNNVWGIARKAAEKILDGTEEWGTYKDFTTDGLKCYVVYNVLSEFGFQNSICTHFKNVDKAWINGIGKNGYYSDHDTVVFKYFITDKPTLEEFKAWLLQQKEAGTPVKLVYKTQTEIWEPLPQETQQALNALHTYYPSTTITNSEDAKMEMSYVADTKKWTENKLTEIVTAHTQGIANLLSLMPLSVQAGMVETDVNNILENVEEMKHE